jgi:hypothetical protein
MDRSTKEARINQTVFFPSNTGCQTFCLLEVNMITQVLHGDFIYNDRPGTGLLLGLYEFHTCFIRSFNLVLNLTLISMNRLIYQE